MAKKLGSWVSRSYGEDSTPWLIAAGVAVIGAVAAVLWAIFADD
jgi:LPXTG-motif cell wall-anchored protein